MDAVGRLQEQLCMSLISNKEALLMDYRRKLLCNVRVSMLQGGESVIVEEDTSKILSDSSKKLVVF